MLGQTVDVTGTGGELVRGVVSAVWLEGDAPKLLVNGQRYDVDDVRSVGSTPVPEPPAAPDWSSDFSALRAQQQLWQANALIGQTVGVRMADGVVESGVVSGVEVESGWPRLLVNGQRYELNRVFSIGPTVTE